MSAATDFNTPDFRGLGPEHLDGLARAVVLLTREVCVLTDRMLVMETVLEAKGIAVAEAIDTHAPDAALQARIDARSEALIGNVLKALAGL
jgi:hypothetical protein